MALVPTAPSLHKHLDIPRRRTITYLLPLAHPLRNIPHTFEHLPRFARWTYQLFFSGD